MNTGRLSLKCYMADTGLLVTQAIEDRTALEEEVLRAILNDFHNKIEIDFLVRQKKKINLIEVKSGEYRRHTSLDRFAEKYSDKIGQQYIVYTKDLRKDGPVTCVPVCMAYCLCRLPIPPAPSHMRTSPLFSSRGCASREPPAAGTGGRSG